VHVTTAPVILIAYIINSVHYCLHVDVIENARMAYQDGFNCAKGKLEATNPVRLGVALNFSVFHHEILNLPKDACKIAKRVSNHNPMHRNLMDTQPQREFAQRYS